METALRLVDEIRARAYTEARSGAHADWAATVRALERQGFSDARLALRQPYVRAHIEKLCRQNRPPMPRKGAAEMAAQASQRSHARSPEA